MEFDFLNNLDLSLFTLEEIDQLKKRIFLKERRGKEVPFVNCIIREKPLSLSDLKPISILFTFVTFGVSTDSTGKGI